MVENNPKSSATVDADDALMRFVIDTARDDVPSLGAKARLLGSDALTSTARNATRPRGLLARILGGRAGYGLGLAVLAAGGAVFLNVTHADSVRVAAPIVSAVPIELAEPAPATTATTPTPATPEVPPSSPPSTTAPVALPRARAKHHLPLEMPAAAVAAPRVEEEPSSTLDREIARIAEARAELVKGDGTRALVLLDSYDAEFPSGAFALDVVVLRIEALARSGRTAEARGLGERFLAAHPQSASARRVTMTLEGIAPKNEDSSAVAAPR